MIAMLQENMDEGEKIRARCVADRNCLYLVCILKKKN